MLSINGYALIRSHILKPFEWSICLALAILFLNVYGTHKLFDKMSQIDNNRDGANSNIIDELWF